jgi:dihydrofolate reductase
MFDTPEENKAEIDQVTAAGAFVMGRNMFGPGRGAWDLGWNGWWGDDPPYHAPVYVLTHHPRELRLERLLDFGPQHAPSPEW